MFCKVEGRQGGVGAESALKPRSEEGGRDGRVEVGVGGGQVGLEEVRP